MRIHRSKLSLGIEMANRTIWYQDKISEHQAIEMAAAKVGNDDLASKAKQSIEHYQELLKQQ